MRTRKNVPAASAVIAAAGLLLVAAPPAHAGLAPDFINTTPSGANTAFNYSAVYSGTVLGEDRLEAGNGVIAPGVVGSADFLTIFDIPGFVSATAPAGFVVQTQLVGFAGPFQAPPDNPALTNVTIRYAGPDVSDDNAFFGFVIVSSFSGQSLGVYSSQRTNNNPGILLDTKIGESGNTIVPVPEPITLPLLAAGGLALARRRRR